MMAALRFPMRRVLAPGGLLLRFGFIAVFLVSALSLAPLASADHGSWLDEPLENWNWAGMAIPVPTGPDIEGGFPLDASEVARCDVDPAATAEEAAVMAAGWAIFAPTHTGTGKAGRDIDVVWGTSGFDGMCRPWGFNGFVFVNGWFAGTISPVEMYSRIDGVVQDVDIEGATLTATFTQYAPTDPLCCPSEPAILVDYRIFWDDAGPVLMPVDKVIHRASWGVE